MTVNINTNLSSARGQRAIDRASSQFNETYQRFTSGQRINRESDDAVGLAISSAFTYSLWGTTSEYVQSASRAALATINGAVTSLAQANQQPQLAI